MVAARDDLTITTLFLNIGDSPITGLVFRAVDVIDVIDLGHGKAVDGNGREEKSGKLEEMHVEEKGVVTCEI